MIHVGGGIVDKGLRLTGNSIHHPGMGMAGVTDGRARQKVDINPSIHVCNCGASPLLYYQGEIAHSKCRGDQGLILSHYLSTSHHSGSLYTYP